MRSILITSSQGVSCDHNSSSLMIVISFSASTTNAQDNDFSSFSYLRDLTLSFSFLEQASLYVQMDCLGMLLKCRFQFRGSGISPDSEFSQSAR